MKLPKWDYAKRCWYKRCYHGTLTWFENLAADYHKLARNQELERTKKKYTK